MEEKIKHKWLVMLCSLIAAFSLWLYTTNLGNVVKTRDILVNIEVENQDVLTKSKLVMLPDQNLAVNLKIKGKAPGIFAVDAKQFKVVVDMNEYVLKKGSNSIPFTVISKPTDIDVINDGLRIDIELDTYASKNFPVEFIQDGTAKAGYYPAKAILKPTDVLVSGPDKYVSTVKSVIVSGSIKNASSDVDLSITPQAVDEANKPVSNVKFNVDVIDVKVPIKKSKSVDINVKTKNTAGKDIYIKSIEPVSKQAIIISKESMDNINALETEPIDLSTITESKTVDAKLIVPNNVELLGDNIVKVKVDIEKSLQKNLSIDIQNKNLNKDYDVILDSPKLSMIVSGAESVINDLKPESISAYIDLNSLDEGTYNVPIIVNIQAKNVNIVSSSPQVVKAVISKKKAAQTKTDDSAQVYTANGSKGDNVQDKKPDDTSGKSTKGSDSGKGNTDGTGINSGSSTSSSDTSGNKETDTFTINGKRDSDTQGKTTDSQPATKTNNSESKTQPISSDKETNSKK